MTDEKLPKYRVLTAWDTHIKKLRDQINALVEVGYKIHTYAPLYTQSEVPGSGETLHHVLMSLSSSTKYEDISNLKDVPPNEVDALLADGWIVADSYSKFLRMVKPVES